MENVDRHYEEWRAETVVMRPPRNANWCSRTFDVRRLRAVGAAAAVLSAGTCMMTAFHLHSRANRELKSSRAGRGKATMISKALFSRRHYTLLWGSDDYTAMIMAPVGWYAMNDTLLR